MEPPSLHVHRSRRAYRATLRPWNYPGGRHLHDMRGNGQVTVGGTDYFVSMALAGEAVACRARIGSS